MLLLFFVVLRRIYYYYYQDIIKWKKNKLNEKEFYKINLHKTDTLCINNDSIKKNGWRTQVFIFINYKIQ